MSQSPVSTVPSTRKIPLPSPDSRLGKEELAQINAEAEADLCAPEAAPAPESAPQQFETKLSEGEIDLDLAGFDEFEPHCDIITPEMLAEDAARAAELLADDPFAHQTEASIGDVMATIEKMEADIAANGLPLKQVLASPKLKLPPWALASQQ